MFVHVKEISIEGLGGLNQYPRIKNDLSQINVNLIQKYHKDMIIEKSKSCCKTITIQQRTGLFSTIYLLEYFPIKMDSSKI